MKVVAQAAAKWPGWLHAENAKGTKFEHQPLVFHCEVRVGEVCSITNLHEEDYHWIAQLQGMLSLED